MPKGSNLTDTPNLMLDRRRQVDAASDERRLFPTFEKNRDEIPIVPGGTFRKAGKSSLQSLSMFRPLDTLSRKSRESGPVRAQGKSKQSVDGQTSPKPRSPSVNHPAALERFERPVKRRRRDIASPASSSAVIDLVDDEDGMLRSPLLLSPQAPRQHRLSSASSQSSSRARRPPESRNNVDEYREVEKLVSAAHRRNSKYGLQKRQGSLADESFARNIRQRRPQSPSLDDESTSASLDRGSKPSILDSVEIYNSGNGVEVRSVEESPTLQKQFVPTNGRRRTADMRESPDELQGEATVRPTPVSLSFTKNRDSTSESRSADRSGKDTRKDTWPISRSDIQPTTFASSGQGQRKKQQKSRRVIGSKSHLHLFEACFFRMGPFERIASQEQAFEVSFDDNNGTIELPAVDEAGETVTLSIRARKITQAFQGVDGSRKVRLKLSKMEGSSDAEIDMEFRTEKDKGNLCDLLETKGVPVWKKPSDWMDKLFEKSKKAEPRQINRCKRPSTEIAADSVTETKTEHVKRPKLSASLQDEEGVVTIEPTGALKQPPRRLPSSSNRDQTSPMPTSGDTHGHPTMTADDSASPIPVKKFVSPALGGRETRSKARRGLVSLIREEEPSDPKLTSDDALPKWSKPLVYPREGKKKAEVERHDFERLREGEFLNDNLIGFYLRFLEHHLERTNPEVSKRTYFFNSYFFATLTNTPKGKRGSINYEGVQKWTRNVDLFSHDYVVVPINESAHWYLAIICNLPSLQWKEKEKEDQEPSDDHRDSPSQSLCEAKEEIPETPPENHSERPAEVAEGAEQLHLESNREETTRESFASMTLSEVAPADCSVSKEHPHESDDDWPEKEENPTSSPPKFSSSRGGSRSADPGEVEEEADQSERHVSQETTEQKRKGRSPSRKDDGCRPTIITFDSLGVTRAPTIRVLRTYLLEEAMSKRSLQIDSKEIRGMKAREIPLQPNFSDCGLYLLAYLEKFAQDPDLFVEKLLKKEMRAERDWPPMKSGLLRRRLRNFLFKLQEEQENIRLKKMSGEYMLVDEKPISFLLGSTEQHGESHAEPNCDGKEVEEEPEEEIKTLVPAKADVSKPVHVTRSTSHKPDDTSLSRTGDINAKHVEHEKSISPVEKKDQPEVVAVEPETDRPETTRPETPETGKPTADELERDTTEIPKNRAPDRELRSSPRRARKKTTREAENALRHQTPDKNDNDNKWVDELWEMTGSPKRVTVEVQVPGTPPSSSRSGMVRQSPRSSPRQVKTRDKRSD